MTWPCCATAGRNGSSPPATPPGPWDLSCGPSPSGTSASSTRARPVSWEASPSRYPCWETRSPRSPRTQRGAGHRLHERHRPGGSSPTPAQGRGEHLDLGGRGCRNTLHRGHTNIEQVNADLKDSSLAHLPSGHFGANNAWQAIAVMAYNRPGPPGNSKSQDRHDSSETGQRPGPHCLQRKENASAPTRCLAPATGPGEALRR